MKIGRALLAVLSLLPTAVYLQPAANTKVTTMLEYIGWRNCSGGAGKNYFRNTVVERPSGNVNYFTAEFVATETARLSKIRIQIYRCNEREGRECEYFMGGAMPDACKIISEKGKPWTAIHNSSEPPFVCPVAKGIYKFSRVYSDTNFIALQAAAIPSVYNYYWKMKATYTAGKKDWSCYEVIARLSRVKA